MSKGKLINKLHDNRKRKDDLQSVRLATPARVVMGILGISPFMVADQLQILHVTDLQQCKGKEMS